MTRLKGEGKRDETVSSVSFVFISHPFRVTAFNKRDDD